MPEQDVGLHPEAGAEREDPAAEIMRLSGEASMLEAQAEAELARADALEAQAADPFGPETKAATFSTAEGEQPNGVMGLTSPAELLGAAYHARVDAAGYLNTAAYRLETAAELSRANTPPDRSGREAEAMQSNAFFLRKRAETIYRNISGGEQ